MTKKKTYRPHHRPARLSSFQRALRDATERLANAIRERNDCALKLDALGREIPYLEEIVRALTPPSEELANAIADEPQLNAAAFARAKANAVAAEDLFRTENLDPVDQAQFLARFMPRPGRTTSLNPAASLPSAIPTPSPSTSNSDDPDEFLKDDGPGLPILD